MSQTEITAQELANWLGGTLINCPPEKSFSEVLPLDRAVQTSISFLSNPKYASKALESKAGLILAAPGRDLGSQPVLEVKDPYLAFARCTQ